MKWTYHMEQRACGVEPLLAVCQEEHLSGLIRSVRLVAEDPKTPNGDDVMASAYHHKVICTAQNGGNDEHEGYVRKRQCSCEEDEPPQAGQ
jgi:hypothetical protein